MQRKGTETLKYLIGLIILLALAGIIVGMGGGSIGDIIRSSGSQGNTNSIATSCSQLGDQIDRNYCSNYVQGPESCGDTRPNPSVGYQQTATQAGCDWQENSGQISDLLDGGEPIVNVAGNEHNCLNRNMMTTSCPAN